MNVNRISGGLAGKILRVDLSSNKISTEDTEKYAKRFVGGRAINSFILLNEMAPETRWSDPENMLIFGTGCLEGTLAPGACRVSVDTKNVYSGGKGSANAGGDWGPELKYAGFDHVVITGKSDEPVYLWIHDGRAELRDAGPVWGKTTWETEEILRKELGDNSIEVASIGPSGENLVRGSAVIFDCAKVAGGGGVGCVMGSKKLKALAVRGHGSIKVAQPEKFFEVATKALKKINKSETTPYFRGGLLKAACQPDSYIWDGCGDVTRNSQGAYAYWPMERREKLMGKDGVTKYMGRFTSCFSCPAGCMPVLTIDKGPYKGLIGRGLWIQSMMYVEKLDIDEPTAAIKYHTQLNQLGLDGDECTVTIAWACECYEKGLLTKQDTDGLDLTWGNADAMIKLAEKIAYRQGIGNLLADGVLEASRKLGKGSEEFALHIKGHGTVDPYRVMKGWGFGVATSPVAGRHLRGSVDTPWGFGPHDGSIKFSLTEYDNIPEAVFWQLQAEAIENITGTCVYMGSYAGCHALEPSDYTELTNSAMGIDLTEEELMLAGKRDYNLEKAFNTIHTNLDRKDDYPHKRFIDDPAKILAGEYKGEYKCDKDKWDEMLDRFYELLGWDKKTSWQTRKCMSQLDLQDIAEKLEKAGKLVE
jgi:aldehyde:ferredoxin oxidoreductase